MTQLAARSLRECALNQVTSLRESKAHALRSFFDDVRTQLAVLSDCPVVSQGMVSLADAARRLPEEWGKPVIRDDLAPAIANVFRDFPRDLGLPGEATPEQMVARNEPGLILQTLYIANNPNPTERWKTATAGDASTYSRLHAEFHPLYLSYYQKFLLYDIFLIDPDGRVVYTVVKEIDLGTNLLTGPLRESALARAFKVARDATPGDAPWVEPFTFYPPSRMSPASFVAKPLFRDGKMIGVLAAQISIDQIDRAASSDHRWKEEGLGSTGEVYLVGPGETLRSNTRFFIEDPEKYLGDLQRVGTDARTIELIRKLKSGILVQKISSAAATESLAGKSATTELISYQGKPAIISYSPFDVSDRLRWGIVAKMDSDEVLAPVAQMRRRTLLFSAIALPGLLALAWALSKYIVAPLKRLSSHARVLGGGNLAARTNISTNDEIGELARAFDDMAQKLQTTTVSRDYVNSIVDSILNAVWVVERDAIKPDDPSAARIVRMNPATASLAGASDVNLLGGALTGLVPAALNGTDWWGAALKGERVSGVELEFQRRDGTQVPVMLAASKLSGSDSSAAQVVCVAQDITERRRAEQATREKDKLIHDMTVAQDIQRQLLPSAAPNIPEYEIAGWSQPADMAGGDYYDWLELPDGRFLACIADVTGHGIGSAMLAAACRAYLRSTSSGLQVNILAGLAAHVNNLLARDMPAGRFVTAAIAVLEPKSHELLVYSAGHAPMFFCHAADRSIETWDSNDIPWGVMSAPESSDARVLHFAPGDALVFITDGFFEWFRDDGEAYGIERLTDTIRANMDEPCSELIRLMHEGVRDFVHPAAQQDDLTAVVIRRLPGKPTSAA